MNAKGINLLVILVIASLVAVIPVVVIFLRRWFE